MERVAAGSHRRVAFVTGAGRGLGLAIARRLAEEGMALVLGDIQEAAVRDQADAMASSGVETLALRLDVSDELSVRAAYEAVRERFGRLDILVNNAGVAGMRAPLEQLPLADWRRTIDVNLTGAFLMAREAVPLMRRGGWGRIVNISSQAARGRTGVGKAHYAASKAGMVGLSRVLADEVGRDGITVNCVAPSRTLTELTRATAAGDRTYFEQGISQTALGRLAEPEDTANAVAFLCSERAGCITGAIIDVTGGAFMP